jgi:hypothetical protein
MSTLSRRLTYSWRALRLFEAVEPVSYLAGSGSDALRAILMFFGTGASAFLATFCTRHFVRTELATTLTMFFTVLGAYCIYIQMRHRQAAV